jgi:hypothetical protein
MFCPGIEQDDTPICAWLVTCTLRPYGRCYLDSAAGCENITPALSMRHVFRASLTRVRRFVRTVTRRQKHPMSL